MTDRWAALKQAMKKASPAPWSHEPTSFNKLDRILYSSRGGTMHGLNLMTLADGDWNHVNNVDFIALARNELPALLEDNRRMREALERMASGPMENQCFCGACVANRTARAALENKS